MPNPVRLVVLALLACTPLAGSAAARADALPPKLAEFLGDFRAAAQSRDAAQLAALTHGASRACATRGDPAAYARLVEQQFRVLGHGVPLEERSYQATTTREADAANSSMAAQGLRWPVEPEGRLVLRFAQEGRTRRANLHVAREGENWRWVHVCIAD